MKRKNSGFSVVELLTVVVIISILVSLLLPGISMVRNLAKTTQQKAQFTALELGIEAFKSDYGQYPESAENETSGGTINHNYQGAQKLAEAMVGRDMLGFHPNTDWGEDLSDYKTYYRGLLSDFDPDGTSKRGTEETDKQNYERRKDLYLDLETANVFRLESDSSNKISGLYDSSYNGLGLDGDSLVLCDAYKRNKVTVYLPGNDDKTKMIKAGNPILYYRANLLSKDSNAAKDKDRIYSYRDNAALVSTVSDVMKDKFDASDEDIYESLRTRENFYEFISDPKLATGSNALKYWPYNSKTYILISAGRDGLYGTEDDICNFDK